MTSHTNLTNKSVRVNAGEDALYPEEDEDDE